MKNAASSKGLNAREKQKTGKEDMRYWVGVEFTFKWPQEGLLGRCLLNKTLKEAVN